MRPRHHRYSNTSDASRGSAGKGKRLPRPRLLHDDGQGRDGVASNRPQCQRRYQRIRAAIEGAALGGPPGAVVGTIVSAFAAYNLYNATHPAPSGSGTETAPAAPAPETNEPVAPVAPEAQPAAPQPAVVQPATSSTTLAPEHRHHTRGEARAKAETTSAEPFPP